MFLFPINKKKLLVSFIIASTAVVGDKNSENQSNAVAAAICDNITHALVGIFTWIGMNIEKTSNFDFYFLVEIALCGIFSSLIDVDHFIAAKSVHLKAATSLKNRPFMHCTSLSILIVFSSLLISNLLKIHWLHKLGWILAAAFFSHHIRDSKRRGFWLWPFGSTAPTPNFLYILAQMMLPHILSSIMSGFAFSQRFRSDSTPIVETV